jgi:ABC-type Fe3+ transport system substrate-binding protein
MKPGAENRKLWLVFAALVALVTLPFCLRPRQNLLAKADDTLVIISPHNEALRFEFTQAFSRYYQATTGRSVLLDWRLPGGSSEIARYLSSEYLAAFQRTWKSTGRLWTAEIASAFDNPKIKPSGNPAIDSPAEAARRAFLSSKIGIGIDAYFGGGGFDFAQQAGAGRLVPSDVVRAHPDWFTDNSFPLNVSGEPLRDSEGRWFGACLSSFGICYNRDSLARLGIAKPPAAWSDLCDPRYARQVALADPNKSGSVAKAFEMVIQQQMQEAVARSGTDTPEGLRQALAQGWLQGLRILQATSANARYFTDSATKIPLEVAQGDAAAGMCIDFYGRFQSEALGTGTAPSRMQYITPKGGSSVGVDPIGILRGAPHRAVAEAFLAFVLSPEGQKLWNFKVGAPGGPEQYALRRLPIRKEIYRPEYAALRSDPAVIPYEEAKAFTYQPGWTSPLFRVIGFVVRVACVDLHEEQAQAWEALRDAGFPKQAREKFSDLSAVDYEVAWNRIKPVLSSHDRLQEVQLARELSEHFREQYRQAGQLAREGK